MTFEGVPQFWRQHESLDALRDQNGFDPADPADEEPEYLWAALRPELRRRSEEGWSEIIARLGLAEIHTFQGRLQENRKDAERIAGADKISHIEIALMIRRIAHPDKGTYRLVRADGPLHLGLIRAAEARDPFRRRLSYRRLGKMLEASDKTVKRWEERMMALGPPEGDLFDYLGRIVNPTPRRGREPP